MPVSSHCLLADVSRLWTRLEYELVDAEYPQDHSLVPRPSVRTCCTYCTPSVNSVLRLL